MLLQFWSALLCSTSYSVPIFRPCSKENLSYGRSFCPDRKPRNDVFRRQVGRDKSLSSRQSLTRARLLFEKTLSIAKTQSPSYFFVPLDTAYVVLPLCDAKRTDGRLVFCFFRTLLVQAVQILGDFKHAFLDGSRKLLDSIERDQLTRLITQTHSK
jgi:hypothetical protein